VFDCFNTNKLAYLFGSFCWGKRDEKILPPSAGYPSYAIAYLSTSLLHCSFISQSLSSDSNNFSSYSFVFLCLSRCTYLVFLAWSCLFSSSNPQTVGTTVGFLVSGLN